MNSDAVKTIFYDLRQIYWKAQLIIISEKMKLIEVIIRVATENIVNESITEIWIINYFMINLNIKLSII